MQESITVFNGDGTDTVSPQDFMRAYRRSMIAAGIVDDQERAENFEFYLRTGSVADQWYAALPAQTRHSWRSLAMEFDDRWEPRTAVKKTQQQLEEELTNLKLDSKDLGKVISVGGLDMYTHISWAHDVLRLAKEAGIENSNSLIWIVRKGLPPIIKELIPATQASWVHFTRAIEDASIEKIKEGAEKERVKQEEADALKARIQQLERQISAPDVAMRNLTARMQRANINTTPAQPINPPVQPANAQAPAAGAQQVRGAYAPASTGGRGNIRYVRQNPLNAPMRASPEEKAAMLPRLTALVHHEDTPAGLAGYAAQVRDWTARHGNIRIDETTPYPLRPGTAMLCSGECFKCGGHGHISSACLVAEESLLPIQERMWRILCTRILGTINRNRAVQVMVVFGDDEEGNGEGPLA
ncbi:hypothetical protein BJ138DRAFT_1019114 [Hygrophoropsis aurantiaca]|uniref:Uncharacterized protein n=1 Tax=Hygrophoropsis aurantiaca TaxID=72124 RepID=A0ACB7ZUK4_9AGAM|nr:hypothetical protein BJ138DRAFT_1019114 [Hygrophoropsis aurantiaca]